MLSECTRAVLEGGIPVTNVPPYLNLNSYSSSSSGIGVCGTFEMSELSSGMLSLLPCDLEASMAQRHVVEMLKSPEPLVSHGRLI